MPWDRSRPRSAEYGSAHAKARKAAAIRHSPTDPCYRCGRPLGPMSRHLHYDHLDDRSGYAGFSHATCNREAGARKGAAIVRAQRRAAEATDGPACRFCRAPIHRGRTYCSRRCGYLANPDRQRQPAEPKPTRQPRAYQPPRSEHPGCCAVCSGALGGQARTYCGPSCRIEGNARNTRERYRAKVGLPADDRPVKRHTPNREW